MLVGEAHDEHGGRRREKRRRCVQGRRPIRAKGLERRRSALLFRMSRAKRCSVRPLTASLPTLQCSTGEAPFLPSTMPGGSLRRVGLRRRRLRLWAELPFGL